MTDPYRELQNKLAELRVGFAERLPQRVAEVCAGWRALGENTSERERGALLRGVHNLAGTGKSFGFARVSQVAQRLEEELRLLWDPLTPSDTERATRIDQLCRDLIAYASDSPHCSEHSGLSDDHVGGIQTWEFEQIRKVLLVEDGVDFAHELALHLEYYGYEIAHRQFPADLVNLVAELQPAAIIMDIVFPNGESLGLQAIAKLHVAMDAMPPVVFLSRREDLEARLTAVRAGGSAYLSKPVDIGKLADTLDHLTAPQESLPFRILIVDDDAEGGQQAALQLQLAGMETQLVTDPMAVSAPLAEFRPELILMDLHMPGCNGLELAEVIRQQPAHLGMPIVFLSAAADIDQHLEALRRGGDDFLLKSMHPEHMVAAVAARAKRARELRAAMVRDSLTGLLNHSSIGEQLNREIARAQRVESPLSYALIDLDHFKSVNDTHGHAVGDHVLVALSRLLRQRMRRTDIVGRYGGEEFAIVMPDTHAAIAHRIVEDLRQQFASVSHQSEVGTFSVTLSAGLACFPACRSASELAKAADDALYRAKSEGRDQVRLAEVCQGGENCGPV